MERETRMVILNRQDLDNRVLLPLSQSSPNSKSSVPSSNSTTQWCKCKPCNRMVVHQLKCFINAMIRTLISSDLSSNRLQPRVTRSRRSRGWTRTLNPMLKSPYRCRLRATVVPSLRPHGLFSIIRMLLTAKMVPVATLNLSSAMLKVGEASLLASDPGPLSLFLSRTSL